MEEEAYFSVMSARVRDLAALGGERITALEHRIRGQTRAREKHLVVPTLLFHFVPGQLVSRRSRVFSKLDPRSTGPYRVTGVMGLYRQRVAIEPVTGTGHRPTIVHASHLVPYDAPYIEPPVIDLSEAAQPPPTPSLA